MTDSSTLAVPRAKVDAALASYDAASPEAKAAARGKVGSEEAAYADALKEANAQIVRDHRPATRAAAGPSVRKPPASSDAEECVIGALLLGAPLAEVGGLSPSAFFWPEHRRIFAAIQAEGQAPDLIALAIRLDADPAWKAPEDSNTMAWLAEMAENTPTAENAGAYAGIVRKLARRRAKIRAAGDLTEAAFSDDAAKDADAKAKLDALDLEPSAELAVPFNDLPEPELIEWLAADLMCLGGVYAIVGGPKAGKTAAARILAAIVASDEERMFLGRKTRRGGVVYVDYENPGNLAHNQFAALKRGGLSLDGLAVHLRARQPADLSAAKAQLRAELEARRPLLAVIDGLQGWAGIDDLTDYSQMHAAISPLRELAEAYQCAIAFMHHGSKHDPSGSNALAGNVDGILVALKKGEGEDAAYSAHTRDLREGRPPGQVQCHHRP